MASDFDELMTHARRDYAGAPVIAHLRREDADVWDPVVVREDGQPFVFWAPGGNAPPSETNVVDDEGNVLMVAISTPPGVEPGGLLAVPASSSGSPTGRLISIVRGDEHTQIAPADAPPPPPPVEGLWELGSLITQAAAHRGDTYQVGELFAENGQPLPVLLDWDHRPLFLWIDAIDADDGGKKLAAIAALEAIDGFVLVTLDDELRPTKSGEEVLQMLDKSPDG